MKPEYATQDELKNAIANALIDNKAAAISAYKERLLYVIDQLDDLEKLSATEVKSIIKDTE